MPTVYYQSAEGQTGFTLRVTDAPGNAPTTSAFTESVTLPGLYSTDNAAAVEGAIASIELDGEVWEGGSGTIMSDGSRLWYVKRTPAVDQQAIIDGVVSELNRQHGTGPWGGGGGAGGGSDTRNPATGWIDRSGNYEFVTIIFAAEDVAGAAQSLVVRAVKREVDAATAQFSGVTLQGDDCIWNVPTDELAGLTIVSGTRIVQTDGTAWTVAGFGETTTGVFGEESRPVCHKEL